VENFEHAQKMNGIEISKNAISRVHVFFGFYPSNPEVYSQYIDPWWEQNIDPQDFIITIEQELGKLAAFLGVATGYGALLATFTGIPAGFVAAYVGVLEGLAVAIPIVGGGASLLEGKNYFTMGEYRPDYMKDSNKYVGYCPDGKVLNTWPGKIINSGLLDDDQYHDPTSLVNY
jgi:hypothetical protein